MASMQQQQDSNVAVVREMTDAIWGPEGSVDAIDEYFAVDVVDHEPGQTIEGRAEYKAFEAEIRQGFPDLEGEIELILAQDDLVAVRYSAAGTHTGSFWGIDPTGKRGEITGNVIYRLEDGVVVEAWHEFDQLGMFQQLGLAPEEFQAA